MPNNLATHNAPARNGVLPEWAEHKAIWTAWPSNPDYWDCPLPPLREEMATFVRAMSTSEPVKLLASTRGDTFATATQACGDCAEIIPMDYGDIWLRDTAPIFGINGQGQKCANVFGFNGWGGSYLMEGDQEVGGKIAKLSGVPAYQHDIVLEGGSVDFNGEGKVLTTRECLLNTNRNPNLSQSDIEKKLGAIFNLDQFIWLEQGLQNDHTDGHIDNIARFVAPNLVACHSPSGTNDPNAATYDAIARDLEKAGVDIVRIPSPGLITDANGAPVAASHMNFIILNKLVIMPSYEQTYAPQAVAALQKLFPSRRVMALPARHILVGGGSFHCITQQETLDDA